MADTETATILIVEDSPTLALTYETYLTPLGYPITQAHTGKVALNHIENQTPSVILLDLKLPDMDGLDILRRVSADGLRSRVIVITAHGSVATAVAAMREGAADFLVKPFSAERLTTTVNTALEVVRLTELVDEYRGRGRSFGDFIGESAPMQAVYSMIQDAAPSRASVFITGESGTGKELCAQAIHRASPRTEAPFIALNCAAIPANLIESEIFGHVKGAFTGATENRDGAAVKASGGTLFLDEICEMPLDLQAKLLRFIQTGQVVPVGSNDARTVNVRFVCATNRDPWEEVAEGRFREDLYYRLHVIPIHLPPLRDRGDDVQKIAQSLLLRFAGEEGKAFHGFSDDAVSRLRTHNWPGNVRELSNVIQSAVVLNDGDVVNGAMLRLPVRQAGDRGTAEKGIGDRETGDRAAIPAGMPPVAETAPDHVAMNGLAAHDLPTMEEEIEPLEIVERRTIEHAIRLCGGSVGRAARRLGVDPSTLYRKIKGWQKAAS